MKEVGLCTMDGTVFTDVEGMDGDLQADSCVDEVIENEVDTDGCCITELGNTVVWYKGILGDDTFTSSGTFSRVFFLSKTSVDSGRCAVDRLPAAVGSGL